MHIEQKRMTELLYYTQSVMAHTVLQVRYIAAISDIITYRIASLKAIKVSISEQNSTGLVKLMSLIYLFIADTISIILYCYIFYVSLSTSVKSCCLQSNTKKYDMGKKTSFVQIVQKT